MEYYFFKYGIFDCRYDKETMEKAKATYARLHGQINFDKFVDVECVDEIYVNRIKKMVDSLPKKIIREEPIRLLPSEKQKSIEKAIKEYEEKGNICIDEPCDCGSRIRHNNGGNYHQIIFLQRDGERDYVKYETTSELEPPAKWRVCNDPHKVIMDHADWL